MSNAELEVAVKLRLGSKIHAHMPHTCICGADIDPEGDHLLKCKRGNEWDTRHTALNQYMASIIQSAHLPVSYEIPIASLAPPRPGFLPPIGRMDLVVTNSDFSTLLADVTITSKPLHEPGSHTSNDESRILCPTQRKFQKL